MKNSHLATYLNDHLAGSVGALEILDRLIDTYHDLPIAQFCREARGEISDDQDDLREVLKALEISESSVRMAGAWLVEKFSRAKIRLEGEGIREPGLVLALESLVLGVKGKEVLWRSLAAVQAKWPPLQRFDFARLVQRAIGQGARIDEQRVAAASEAFAP